MSPASASSTPGMLRNSTSTCQKHPAPNVAFSLIDLLSSPRLSRRWGRGVTFGQMSQQPVELIMARNLLSSLSTPAFLVDEDGVLVFYNDAAGALLGKRFEEMGRMRPDEWGTQFGPVDRS